jgi:hypothetical protein
MVADAGPSIAVEFSRLKWIGASAAVLWHTVHARDR